MQKHDPGFEYSTADVDTRQHIRVSERAEDEEGTKDTYPATRLVAAAAPSTF